MKLMIEISQDSIQSVKFYDSWKPVKNISQVVKYKWLDNSAPRQVVKLLKFVGLVLSVKFYDLYNL